MVSLQACDVEREAETSLAQSCRKPRAEPFLLPNHFDLDLLQYQNMSPRPAQLRYIDIEPTHPFQLSQVSCGYDSG